MLGLASCGLASASLPCGSHFPPSPLDLLELEAFHGLSLPQAKPQISGKAGEVARAALGWLLGSRRSEVGLENGGFILEALAPGLTRKDQELRLSSWTLSLELDQSASVPQACFCSCFHLQTGVPLVAPSQPVLFLGASQLAPPALQGCVCTRSLRRPGPVIPPRWRCCLQLAEKCPLLHPRVSGCQEGDLSLSNARVWINLSPSHCEGEGAISVCPSREIFAAEEAKGVAYCPPPQPSPAFLVLSACRWGRWPPAGHLAFAPHLEEASHPGCSHCKNSYMPVHSSFLQPAASNLQGICLSPLYPRVSR